MTTINSISIFSAAERGDAERVKFLIERRHNVNYVELKSGMTSLQVASKKGYLDVVEELVRGGASLDYRVKKATERGATALYLAAKYGHPEVVRFLIANGANKDLKGDVNAFRRGGKLPESVALENAELALAMQEAFEQGFDPVLDPREWQLSDGFAQDMAGSDVIYTECPKCKLSLQAFPESEQRALAKLQCGHIYHMDCLMEASADQSGDKFVCLACGSLNSRRYVVPEPFLDGYHAFPQAYLANQCIGQTCRALIF